MTSLLGRKIDQSYTEILKLADSGITSSLQRIQDGAGNNTPISISTTAVSLNSIKLSNVANPTLPQDAATKAYVDGLASKAGGTNTQIQYNLGDVLAGDTGFTTNGTGSVNIVGDLDVDNININGNTIASTNTNGNIVLDPNGTGVIDASTSRIINVTNPTSAQDAATKAYVDGLASATSNYLKINSTGAAASATGTDSIALGENTSSSGTNSIAIGPGVTNSISNTVKIGTSNTNFMELGSTGNLKLYTTSTNVGLAADGSAATINLTLSPKGASGVISASNFKISNVADPVSAQDAVTKNYLTWQNIDGLPTSSVSLVETLKVENGFDDRTTTTISFNNGTRTFTIAPTGASFTFFAGGLKYIKSTPQSIVIPDTEGLFFIYFDTAGNLTTVPAFSIPIISDHAYVAAGYWDATNDIAIVLGDERHGRTMDATTRAYLHRTLGTRYDSGLGFGNIVADSTGDAASAQFSIADGIIHDEDITINITNNTPQPLSPIAEIPLFYKLGAAGNWRRFNPTQFPIRTFDGTSSTRAAWNNPNGGGAGIWGLSEIPSGQFGLTHIFATNDINYPMVGVIGQEVYTTIADAQVAANTVIRNLTLDQMESLFQEFKAIGTLIFETNLAYTNAVNSRIRTTDNGGDWVDFRNSDLGSGASSNTTNDHGNLTGLSDDDHTQYILVTGTRAFTGTVSGVTPTAATHLTTKSYVDSLANRAGGTNTQIQYNLGDLLAGDTGFTTNGTGSVNIVGDLDVDNININGNTISSTNTNGNIILAPNGTGSTLIQTTGALTADLLVVEQTSGTATDGNGIRNRAHRPHITLEDISASTTDFQIWADGGKLAILSGDASIAGKLSTTQIEIDPVASTISMSTNKLTNVANPTTPQDAATKLYVDNYSIPKSTATVITTNATTTTLQTIAIPLNEARIIVARVVSSDSSNNTFWRFIRACVKNVSGVASIVGGIASDQGYDPGASTWSANLTTSGSSALIQVTGQLATTINWYVTTEITR